VPDPVNSASYTPISQVLNYGSSQGAVAPTDQFGKDTFLKLLVAQLRYQDPMNPAEGAEFMSQTAQFTSVEKLTEVADLQTQLLSAQRLLGASNLVGRTITFVDADGTDATGVVSAARLSADGPVLRVADKDVPLTAVKEVSDRTTS
jgi:flagellar basal-body rod modification protein FlgD